MKNSEKNIDLQRVLNNKRSENITRNRQALDNHANDIRRKKINFIHKIYYTLKSIYNNLFIEDYDCGYKEEFTQFNIISGIRNDPSPNITLQKKEIITIIINNFDDKYIYPFLLKSLGYSNEEIGSILLTPTNIIRSRIFYVQKRVQQLLMSDSDINNK